MTARSHNRPLAVEALEGRTMMSAVAYADFNSDGLVDKAAITNPTTVTVSLAKPDGSYAVSATLTTPSNRPARDINVGDFNADGKVDINTSGATSPDRWYVHTWLGAGNGTFGSRTTELFRWKIGHGGTW